jgi:hypothetical protein
VRVKCEGKASEHKIERDLNFFFFFFFIMYRVIFSSFKLGSLFLLSMRQF